MVPLCDPPADAERLPRLTGSRRRYSGAYTCYERYTCNCYYTRTWTCIAESIAEALSLRSHAASTASAQVPNPQPAPAFFAPSGKWRLPSDYIAHLAAEFEAGKTTPPGKKKKTKGGVEELTNEQGF